MLLHKLRHEYVKRIQNCNALCLGSCQLSRGFEESGNQSNKQISATFRKIIFHFQAKVKSTRHNKNVLIRLSYGITPS